MLFCIESTSTFICTLFRLLNTFGIIYKLFDFVNVKCNKSTKIVVFAHFDAKIPEENFFRDAQLITANESVVSQINELSAYSQEVAAQSVTTLSHVETSSDLSTDVSRNLDQLYTMVQDVNHN